MVNLDDARAGIQPRAGSASLALLLCIHYFGQEPPMLRTLKVTVVALVAVVATALPASAAFWQTAPSTTYVHPADLRVTSATQTAWNRLSVRFNSGAEGVFTNCAHEDSAGDCFWNARQMGNGQGRSFVVLNGRTMYLPAGADLY